MDCIASGFGSRGARGACAVLAGLIIVSCGGGGDASAPAKVTPTVDVASANRDSVGHAAVAGVLAMNPVGAVPLGLGVARSERQHALAADAASASIVPRSLLALLLAPVRPEMSRPHAKSMHALAVTGPIIEPCILSGSVSVSVDDRDDSGTATVGDVLTISYQQCQDTPFETLDGTVTSVYTLISQSPMPAVGARMTMTGLSGHSARHSLTLDGSVLLDYSMPSSSVEEMSLTADGPFVARVVTHLFSDTVTLLSGFVERLSTDANGRSSVAAHGGVDSVAAGGVVAVSTDAGSPLVQWSFEAYPSSGALTALGRRGSVRLTALSADAARLDLDSNDDGAIEASDAVAWDWLL